MIGINIEIYSENGLIKKYRNCEFYNIIDGGVLFIKFRSGKSIYFKNYEYFEVEEMDY